MSPLHRSKFTNGESLLVLTATCCVLAICWWFTPAATAGLLVNTGQLALAVMLISLPTAACLSYAFVHCKIPGRWLLETCLLLLLFMPLYVQLASWEAGFGRGGWYSTLITEKLRNPPLEGFRGAVWVHAMACIPWLFWIFRWGLAQVPRSYQEAAMLDATPRQVFVRIVVPLSLPVIVAGALYVLIVVSTEITVTDRYQFRSYAEVLYNEFVLSTSFDALPLSVAPIVASMVWVSVCGLAICRLLWPRAIHPTVSREAIDARSANWPAFVVVGFVVSLLLFLPIGNLLYQAGIEVRSYEGGRVRVWSFGKLFDIVGSTPFRYRKELAWTTVLSQLSVAAAVCSALAVGWWARASRCRQALNACVGIVCFVTPGPFIGLGIIWTLNRPSPQCLGWLYDDTIFAPWLAITIRCFPFAYLIVWYGIRSIPRTLLEAAESDGANYFACLRFVALPLLSPSLICAALVCLAISIGELSASVLVMPPGVTTVATEIFNLIHYGAEDQLAGLCLSCLVVTAVISLLAGIALKRFLNPTVR